MAKARIACIVRNIQSSKSRLGNLLLMSIDIDPNPPEQLPSEIACCATEKVRGMYRCAATKAGESLAAGKKCVRKNPVPVVLGAVVLGAAVGFLILNSRRKLTFVERFADEPLSSVREAILTALAPVSQRVHDGYESAQQGVGKAFDRAGRFGRSRAGKNFRFW